MTTIYIKSLSGDLYELNDVKDVEDVQDIAQQLVHRYPNEFSNDTQIVKYKDLFCVISTPPKKIVEFKKKVKKDNSDCLYIGVKLFDCIQNVQFYEEGEQVDVDLDEIQEIYSFYRRGTSILGPDRLGVDSNRLNVMKRNESSDDYICSMGNFGSKVRGSDLKTILSQPFEQSICCTSVAKKGIPHYLIKFQFKSEAIEQIMSIVNDRL
jgi:hypothetical protein